MKKIILGILALLSGQVALAEGVQPISAQQAAQMQAEQKAVIVDVRENDEWNAGHIAGAIHIPLGEIKTRAAELEQYKNSPLITQCRSGGRSATAADMLKTAGFNKLYNMDGGLNAWQKADLKIQQN
ncbi:MAG: rhodanese-like domain-containing protein [Methylococcaceae bacterium]